MEWIELVKLGFALLLSGVLSFYLTPVVRKAAIAFGIVDRPDGKLKSQERPVAYMGGIPIFLALLLTISLAYEFNSAALGILLGTTIVIVLGLIDDLGALPPFVKIGGQLVAVWVLFKAGIYVQISWLPMPLNWFLTLLWVIGVTNAFNLIDIMDGLAAGVALIACIFLTVISFVNGNYLFAATIVSLAGSLIGFLPHNFRPATIYLGDTGSMAIGFALAAITIVERYTVQNEVVGIAAPMVIMGIPLFETAFLTVIRTVKGIPPFRGSPDHFAIRLRRLGWSVERTVVVTYCACAILGGLGVAIVYAPYAVSWGLAVAVAVMAILAAGFLYAIDESKSAKGAD